LASGHFDTELSAAGRRQAVELGQRYSERALSVVYTSDLRRSVATAEIAFAHRKLVHVVDRRLRECDYGVWTRCPAQQLDQMRANFIDDRFPDGESYRDVVRRIEDFLKHLAAGEGEVLVIGHRAQWHAFEHLLKGRDLFEVITSSWKWQPGWKYLL
jgi:broad specificity phosphatase PhoE